MSLRFGRMVKVESSESLSALESTWAGNQEGLQTAPSKGSSMRRERRKMKSSVDFWYLTKNYAI